MRVLDDDTSGAARHMVEVSSVGVKLETSSSLQRTRTITCVWNSPPSWLDRPYIIFVARTKLVQNWHHPNLYQCGFEIIEIMPEDKELLLISLQNTVKNQRPRFSCGIVGQNTILRFSRE